MTDGMKQKVADMAYKEAERLRWMNVRGLMEIAYGLASLSASWYHNNVWHSPKEEPKQGMAFALIEDDGTLTASYTMLEGGMNWEKIKDIDGCQCWAYCEDLLPTPGYKRI